MTERPILFSGPMVRALLAGRKTQTRRLIKWVPVAGHNLAFSGLEAGHYCTGVPASGWVLRSRGAGGCWNDRTERLLCPYGQPADRLWVRETWAAGACSEGLSPRCLSPNFYRGPRSDNTGLWYSADGAEPVHPVTSRGRWRSSIHMPRWASRLTLEVTDVRAERLQDISEADARAEGFSSDPMPGLINGEPADFRFFDSRTWFAHLWNSINGERAPWAENPWVWVVSFSRVDAQTTPTLEAPPAGAPETRR